MNIRNYRNYSLVSGSEDNDYISNNGRNVTINALGGNDSIQNSGANSTISGGAGNDSISNSGANVTIGGGAGNDSVFNQGNQVVFKYSEGNGNDFIRGFRTNSTLDLGGATYETAVSGYDVIVTVGDSKITLQSAATLPTVNISGAVLDKALNIRSAESYISLVGGSNDDRIINYGGNFVTIAGGAGNDYINSSGNFVTILGEAGNDSIRSSYSDVTIDGGTGNDYIDNNSSESSVNGGAGNDSIINYGSNAKIYGGAGDDSIKNDSRNILFRYNEGDGNDIIRGFRADSTLNISGTSYTTTKSGNNIIVTVGEGKITLAGAANLSTVNIKFDNADKALNVRNTRSNVSLVGGENDDTIINSGYDVTIAGKGGNDSISNNGSTVTIDGGLGDDFIFNNSNGHHYSDSTINGGSGNDTINNRARNVTIDGGDGNDSVSNSEQRVTIRGGAGDDTITSNGSLTAMDGGAGNDSISNSGTGSTIAGGAGNDSIYNSGAYVMIEGGAGDDSIETKTGTVFFRYNVGDGNDIIKGFSNNSSLGLAAGLYATTTKSGNDLIVTIGENKLTLQGAASLSNVNIIEVPVNINNRSNYQNIIARNADDTITNRGRYVTIDALGGNDSITNYGNFTTIYGGNDNDTIFNNGGNIFIDSGAGNDTIHNDGGLDSSNVIVDSGAGDDTIENDGRSFTFQYKEGDGNDIVYGFRADSHIFIANGKYYSQVRGDDIVITLGEGQVTLDGAALLPNAIILNPDVSVVNRNKNEILVGSDANESFTNRGENVTIDAQGGNDSISNYYSGENVSIDSGSGNDSIRNEGIRATIRAGEGNDSIRNFGVNATILGGDGNDTIQNDYNTYIGSRNGGTGSTISGGAGDDSIVNHQEVKRVVFQYREGDGNDTIFGFNESSTLDLGGVKYASVRSGSDIILTIGDGKITLVGAMNLETVNINGVIDQPLEIGNRKNDASIVGSNYSDTITNTGKNVTIDARGGNDSVSNNASIVTIAGSSGDDSISNQASAVTISGGLGNDSISNSGSDVSISDGNGNDNIFNNGSNVTIEGGAGLDTIEIGENGNNALIKYNASAGGDRIIGFKENSTLLISGGVPATTTKSGNDIFVTVGRRGIRLQDAASLSNVNIVETPVNINNSASKRSFNGTNANDTIINTGDKVSIAALKGNDSLSNNAAYVSINGGEGADKISNTGRDVTIDGGTGNDTIYNNASRGLVLGSSDNDSIFNHGEGSTISGGNGNDSIENYTDSNRVSIAASVGDDSISNAGHNVTIDGGAGNDTVSSNGTANSIYGGAGDDFISVKGSYKNTILGGAGNDTISLDWGSNKALILHTAGDGNDYVEGFNSTATLQIGDGNDTYDKAIEGDDIIITAGKENITLKGAAKLTRFSIAGVTQLKVNNITNAASIIGDRLDDSIANSGHKVTISAVAGNDTIENSGRYVSIYGGTDNDKISNTNSNFATIDGAEGNDTITATNSNFVTINGASGNDVISVSGGARNTVSGGTGDDSIYVAQSEDILINHSTGDGNDYINGFNENSTLQIGESTDTFSQSVSDGNIIVTVGEETITLAGAANLETVNVIGTEIIEGKNISNSDENVVLNGNAGNDTISNAAQNVTINGNAGNDSISNVAQNVTINGNAGNDSISNTAQNVTINGNAGNDSISNTAQNVIINSGAGDDSIRNTAQNVTLEGDIGNDIIENRAENVTISGNAGNDSNYNAGSNVVFDYIIGDGNDTIEGFNYTSTLNISGEEYSSATSGDDVIVSIGGGTITIKDAATLDAINIVQVTKESPLNVANKEEEISIVGTAFDDTISNNGEYVTITAQGGNDSIFNQANNTTIDGGAGKDTIVNDYAFYSSIAGGEGSDVISVASSSQVTINAGKADDTINLSNNDETFIEYNAGDGNDFITGFDEYSTLNIVKTEFTSATTDSGDVVITVGKDKITLEGAANLSNPHIASGTYATFTVKNSKVTCETDLPDAVIKKSYSFNNDSNSLVLNSELKDKIVKVKAEDAAKVNWHYGTASLSGNSTLQYQLADGENNVTLTSKAYGDKVTLDEKATFNYGRIQAEVQENGTISTKAANRISFENNSSASVTARRDYIIDVDESNITVNDLPINARNGAGTVTVQRNGLNFTGYGVQFADLEIAKESYFGKLAPMTVTYDSSEEVYKIYSTSCVKTLSNDFIKLTFDFKSGMEDGTESDDKYAYYEINDVAILATKDEENISVVEVNGSTFKVEDKEIDTEKIGRITFDEQITFSGTEIKYDGVETNYTLNKQVIYSADGKEITINDAATLTTDDENRTFKCEAGSYVINRRSFETTTDLTFTADANQIKIPLNDKTTEIYFDGVKVSGISGGGEIVFDLAEDKVTIPDGAELNITALDEVKLNLAAGTFTIDNKKISIDTELEITVDRDNVKIPLSENAVTINGAAITGTGEATIDNTNELFCSILLPDGALVKNTSDNLFQLIGKNSSASFGNANKKIQLTSDGTTYVEYDKENIISVGHNRFLFEQVEIQGVDSWTIDSPGANGINKITGIKNGATISTSTEYIDAGDLRFEVETDGAGEFTIAGQKCTSTSNDKNTYVVYGDSSGEIKVALQGEEYKDDDSEAAGNSYPFDTAGDYTVNGITFHATANSKAQTITRGVEFDLSSGTFQYDGLTLNGAGTAQINRYNAKLVSLTDGAIVKGDDESKYYNRQFEINGAVELIGKKFETNQQIRCGLIDVQDTIDNTPLDLKGFFVDDKYVQIQSDCYESVKVVDKNITSIEGVKASAELTCNGLSNISIVTTESGEFTIKGKTYNISNDSDGVTFVTDSHGYISEINGLKGSVEGNFENKISVNGKAVRLTGASSVKITSDGKNITEISNVAGDLVTADGNNYRKDVRVYELGGAENLTTSADGTIIFSGNKFEMSAGKIFTLDDSGNVSKIDNTEKALSAFTTSFDTIEENIATINLSTTNELEEVSGDFSEGLLVNGVFVRVTDSTNFVVKNDSEDIYIETTAADTFTINGKTFKTFADKTIFKLDSSGNVSEIVTDIFYLYPDENTYLIEGDFNDEIIFNGKKFCVTGTDETTIFIGDETLISIDLVRNNVDIVENGGANEIAVNGSGNLGVGGRVLSTSDGFAGVLKYVEGSGYSVEDFTGTISGELGGLELAGLVINSEDNFSVTSDGEKIIAIDNLQNGSLTCDNLDGITINGEKISFDNSEEVTLTVTNGKLKISAGTASSVEEFLNNLTDYISVKENITLSGSDIAVVEDTAPKVSIKASKGEDTIYTAGKHVNIDLKSGGETKIFTAQGRVTVDNYKSTSGAGFVTNYNDFNSAIENGTIVFHKGKLTIDDSAVVDFGTNSELINFYDTEDNLQKIGFASGSSKLDVGNEKKNLILVGGLDSTLRGGTGKNQIYLEENGESTIALNGRNTIHNFNASFDDGDKILIGAKDCDFSFDGENVSVKSGDTRALLENISSSDNAAKILTIANGKETKTAIAQKGEVIATGDDLADVYYGKKSGVDFTGYEESLTIDLNKNFYGINQITVGGGLNTLIGSSSNETLSGSTGTTEYIFDKGNGRDVINDFNFDADKISVGAAVTSVSMNEADGVRLQLGDDRLTLEDAQGKIFKINEFAALVDENITYDAEANYFVATSKEASVTVNEGAEIWLDGSHGKTFVGDIKILDASKSEDKNILAGNDLDNTILAGNGDASLWGGNGGDDLLIGGACKNIFFYCVGNGNDTIQNANDSDAIILSTVTLDQISGTSITASGVSMNFVDGSTLQVNSNSDVTYQLADGSQYSANHEQSVWINKNSNNSH